MQLLNEMKQPICMGTSHNTRYNIENNTLEPELISCWQAVFLKTSSNYRIDMRDRLKWETMASYFYLFTCSIFLCPSKCHFNQRSCFVEMIKALSPIHCRLTGILLSSYVIKWDIVVLVKSVQPTLIIILTIPSNLHIFSLSVESKNHLVCIRSHS